MSMNKLVDSFVALKVFYLNDLFTLHLQLRKDARETKNKQDSNLLLTASC